MQSLSTRRQQSIFFSPELLIILVFYAAGISWAEILGLHTQFLLFSSLILLCFLFIIYICRIELNSTVSRFILGSLYFLLGLLQYPQLQLNPPADPYHIYNLIKSRQTVCFEGILQKYPSVIKSSSGSETRLIVKVKTLYQTAGQVPQILQYSKASGLVFLTLNGQLPEGLNPGDRFLVKTNLSRVHTYSTPGSFNYKKYLATQSIFIKGWVQSPHSIIKIHSSESYLLTSVLTTLFYLPERIRNHIAGFLDKSLSQPARGLYKAILIGDRNDVPVSVLNNFARAGCLHILAISGMHMGLLALITIGIIFWIIKRSTWLLLHTPALKIAVSIAFLPLFIYALIAGLNIPVLRALLMTIVFILAILFDRPGNLINHILLAAFLILAWKPFVIFSASFQLSFSAVIAIGLIYPLFYRFLFQEFRTTFSISANTPVIVNHPPAGLIRKSAIIIFKWFLSGVVLSTAAMLGTFPLLLFHFNKFSPVAPFSNLLVEPLICFWSLIIGLAASLSLPLKPALAKILFTTGGLGLIAAERICAFFSALPFSSLWLPTPSPVEIMAAYLFLLSSIMALHLWGRQRRCSFVLAFFFLFSAAAINTIAKKPSGAASITFLDVGHGSSILLQLPENKNILIDGGSSTQNDRFNIGERVIGPFLWKQKLNHLDAVVITHPHADHYNGLPFILARFRPKELWINGRPGHDKEYQELLDLASQLGIDTKIAKNDDVLFQTSTTRLVCLHSGGATSSPIFSQDQDRLINPNDLSIVLRLETNTKSFLFPADISAVTAETLSRKSTQIKADILMAPHHGSSSSMSQNFIRTVAPEYLVISAGRDNPFNFPAKSFYDLQQKGIEVLSTDRDGTITFEVKNVGSRKIFVSRYQVN